MWSRFSRVELDDAMCGCRFGKVELDADCTGLYGYGEMIQGAVLVWQYTVMFVSVSVLDPRVSSCLVSVPDSEVLPGLVSVMYCVVSFWIV